MLSVLRQQVSDFGISNVTLVASRWEEAEVEPADIVLCAHVLYTIRDIAPFVRKLDAHAREQVLVLLFQEPPQARLHPLWERIHGEPRRPLPSLPELQTVLQELGIEAQIEVLPPQQPRGYDSLEEARNQLSRRLYLKPDDPKTAQLEQMLPECLEEVDGIIQIRGAGRVESALIRWCPVSAAYTCPP
jgi:hypothetical protein